MNKIVLASLIVAVVIALIVFCPFLLIYSLNTLFPSVAIPYTLGTWFAAFWVTLVFAPKKVN